MWGALWFPKLDKQWLGVAPSTAATLKRTPELFIAQAVDPRQVALYGPVLLSSTLVFVLFVMVNAPSRRTLSQSLRRSVGRWS